LNDLEVRSADPFSLAGKVAVVTGGTGVLGGAMASGLAQRGAKVGILGRRKQEADRAASEIAQTGGEALPLLADVLDRTNLEDARDVLSAHWDRLDILVNAAGATCRQPRSTRMPLSLSYRKSRCGRCLTSTS
jgi:NADP-dependent 3-hydroxy acid dehydrogenase YdfG